VVLIFLFPSSLSLFDCSDCVDSELNTPVWQVTTYANKDYSVGGMRDQLIVSMLFMDLCNTLLNTLMTY
jgi:hypothetical protein